MIHRTQVHCENLACGLMAPSDDLGLLEFQPQLSLAEYYYDNLDLEGFGEEVSSKRNFHLGRNKDAGNMTLAELVSWAEEEANSPCFHTPHRHLGEVSKMIIEDNDDEHVANNIVAKGVDYDIAAMEVVDNNIIVSNDNVGAIVAGDNQVVIDNLVGVHLVVSPTNEEHVDVIGIIGDFENEIINGDDENEHGEDGGETIILDVDIEVHNFSVDDIVVHPTIDVMESLDDTTNNVDNGNLSNVTPSGNEGTMQFIPTRKSQRINNQKKEPKLACVVSTSKATP
ncbi:hypothetical protein Tco_1403319 [Tanacetum coccineum]